ncbi:MAG: phosphoribosylformylglycinamidine cyclo-ligase [Pseudomonadota bacterium]
MSDHDPEPSKPGLTYAQAGVSIASGDSLVERIKPAAAATARPGVMGGLGGFGALFDLAQAGFRDPVLVTGTDGVGTKLKIAIETGELGGVGVDLVAMCVNDLLCHGADPLIFLDYFATGVLRPDAAAQVIEGVARGCAEAGAALVGGETAEMPGLYHGDDFDLAGFCVGAVEREGLLPRPEIPVGAALIGLESDGAHSNGFSLIRRIVADQGLAWDAPAPFAPETRLGAALLRPTRIYVKPVLAALREPSLGASILGLAHITGGGLKENPGRALPPSRACEIDLGAWTRPPLFRWLAEAGGVAEEEMTKAFNCGLGMVLIVAKEAAPACAAFLTARGERAHMIGEVAPRGDDAPATRLLGAPA